MGHRCLYRCSLVAGANVSCPRKSAGTVNTARSCGGCWARRVCQLSNSDWPRTDGRAALSGNGVEISGVRAGQGRLRTSCVGVLHLCHAVSIFPGITDRALHDFKHLVVSDCDDHLEPNAENAHYASGTASGYQDARSRDSHDGSAVCFVSAHWPTVERAVKDRAGYDRYERYAQAGGCQSLGSLCGGGLSRSV